jgi:hypothetical protein
MESGYTDERCSIKWRKGCFGNVGHVGYVECCDTVTISTGVEFGANILALFATDVTNYFFPSKQ